MVEVEWTAVQEYCERESCGEVYADGDSPRERLSSQAERRYQLEPYLRPFARFDGAGRDVLEIGVGMGADHMEWARSSPKRLVGVDFTSRAVDWTANRLAVEGFSSRVLQADAERLPFPDGSFDLVYSWGVLHHTARPERAFSELHRVLRKGGQARVMVYHRPSIVGFLLWVRYALLAGRPGKSLAEVYAEHLESPGTKGYTIVEGRNLLRNFSGAEVRSRLGFGDLLQGAVGQQHDGAALRLLRKVWPRRLIERLLPGFGLLLLMEATK
ncbi:MAG: class I SAM-dependent methyltransferase [Acidimicrobiales bacterium]